MPIEPTSIFYLTMFILIILEGIVIYLIWSYYRLLKSYDSVISKQREMEEKLVLKSQEMLQAAEQQAQAVVATANIKAQQIVTQSQGFNQQTQKVIQDSLQAFLTEQTRVYKQTFDTVRSDVLAYAQELNLAYRKRADQEIVQINEAFTREMQQATKTAQMSLEEAYEKVEAEVEQYKKHRIATVESQMSELVKRVSREVLHNSLDAAAHEQLIMEALDDARRDHII